MGIDSPEKWHQASINLHGCLNLSTRERGVCIVLPGEVVGSFTLETLAREICRAPASYWLTLQRGLQIAIDLAVWLQLQLAHCVMRWKVCPLPSGSFQKQSSKRLQTLQMTWAGAGKW